MSAVHAAAARVVQVCLAALAVAGCTRGLGVEDGANRFRCATDDDCLPGWTCGPPGAAEGARWCGRADVAAADGSSGAGDAGASDGAPSADVPSTCHNGQDDPGEACDGDAVACLAVGDPSVGYAHCRADCSGYDLGTCGIAPECGNGLVEPGETCDARILDCPGGEGGASGVAFCGADCQTLDTDRCGGAPHGATRFPGPCAEAYCWSLGACDWVTLRRYTYDEAQRLTRQEIGLPSSLDAVVTYAYDDAGRLTREEWDGDDSTYGVHADGSVNRRLTYGYDAGGRLLTIDEDGVPDESWEYSYVLDEFGRVAAELRRVAGEDRVETRTSYEYDVSGRVVAREVDGPGADRLRPGWFDGRPDERCVYHYDEDGLRTGAECDRADASGDGRPDHVYRTSYDCEAASAAPAEAQR
jgi:hypothetical protein